MIIVIYLQSISASLSFSPSCAAAIHLVEFSRVHFSINLRLCIDVEQNKDRDERCSSREDVKRNPWSTVIYIGEKKWMASASPSTRRDRSSSAIMHYFLLLLCISSLGKFRSCNISPFATAYIPPNDAWMVSPFHKKVEKRERRKKNYPKDRSERKRTDKNA